MLSRPTSSAATVTNAYKKHSHTCTFATCLKIREEGLLYLTSSLAKNFASNKSQQWAVRPSIYWISAFTIIWHIKLNMWSDKPIILT